MTRTTRYQGAIIREHHILLLKQTEHASGRSYWLLPGGRIEPEETEERCVQREVLTKTTAAPIMFVGAWATILALRLHRPHTVPTGR